MNFSHNSFDPETLQEKWEKSEARRSNGRIQIAEVEPAFERLKADTIAVGEMQGKSAMEVLTNFLQGKENEPMLEEIENYLYSRGYTPDSNLINLCMQAAYARGEHIREVQDQYDSDNFIFGGKNKARRQERRAQRRENRQTRKDNRVQKRHERKTARQDARAERKATRQEMRAQKRAESQSAEMPEELSQEIEQTELYPQDGQDIQDGGYLPATPSEMPYIEPEFAEEEYAEGGLPPEGLDISEDEALAEIVGQEMENESYEGEQKLWLTALNAAVDVGQNALARAVAQKQAAKAAGKPAPSLGKLFTKNVKPGAERIVKKVKDAEKKKEVKKMMPMIIGAALLAIGIGYYIRKPKG